MWLSSKFLVLYDQIGNSYFQNVWLNWWQLKTNLFEGLILKINERCHYFWRKHSKNSFYLIYMLSNLFLLAFFLTENWPFSSKLGHFWRNWEHFRLKLRLFVIKNGSVLTKFGYFVRNRGPFRWNLKFCKQKWVFFQNEVILQKSRALSLEINAFWDKNRLTLSTAGPSAKSVKVFSLVKSETS